LYPKLDGLFSGHPAGWIVGMSGGCLVLWMSRSVVYWYVGWFRRFPDGWLVFWYTIYLFKWKTRNPTILFSL